MSYQLTLTEPLATELRRVAHEQLGDAVSDLRDPARNRVDAVHDARKAVKKVRALRRLATSSLPKAARSAESQALRDAGRLLSGTRDADVMALAAQGLRDRFAGRVPA